MMNRKPRGTYFDELRNHQLLIQTCNIFPCFWNGHCRLNSQLLLIDYNDRLYDRDRNCERVDVVRCTASHFSSSRAQYTTSPPYSSFVLLLTRNPVGKTKIPYSFALVRMSRGFQCLCTFMAVSAWCKECAVLNRGIVRLDSTRGIHVRLCFFCICVPMYIEAWEPLSKEHSRMFIKKI